MLEELQNQIDKRDRVIIDLGACRRRMIELEAEELSLTRSIIALNKHMIHEAKKYGQISIQYSQVEKTAGVEAVQ